MEVIPYGDCKKSSLTQVKAKFKSKRYVGSTLEKVP